MCGIAGVLSLSSQEFVDPGMLQSMVRQLHHRGPDGRGFFLDAQIGLGHSRLSIIDLDTGQQPIHNEDESIWVVFNGEIFNYKELTSELKSLGHRFYTRSDTEVIVHLYEQFGDDFATKLNGQFAIALWDKRNQRLVLVRDRPGIHPLFYKVEQERILFGSEIKAILPVMNDPPAMNLSVLDEIMTFWAPCSSDTIFAGIKSLLPGHMLIIENGKVSEKAYWDWSFPTDARYRVADERELADELYELLADATRIRLRSDVPVGAYLSGGLDSSALVSIVHGLGDTSLRTFSIEFENQELDESGYQKEMIEFVGANHSSINCKSSDIAEGFEKTILHTESPILRTAPVPMGILSSLVHDQGYKVVLTGEGSDEVLGGYDIFKETKIRQFWAKKPHSDIRPLLLKKLYPYLEMGQGKAQAYSRNFYSMALDNPKLPWFSHLTRWETTAKCKHFFSDSVKSQLGEDALSRMESLLPADINKWSFFNRAQYIEAKSLMAGYLLASQGDRMLMMNSVEGRFPFLDHRVIEFANSLDPRMKMKVLNEKYLLKRAMQNRIPESIINRYKQPYRAPDIPAFFSGQVPEFVNDLLSEEAISNAGYFNPKKVTLLLKKIHKGLTMGYRDNMAFVGILSTQLWHHQFVEKYHENFSNSNSDSNESIQKIATGASYVS